MLTIPGHDLANALMLKFFPTDQHDRALLRLNSIHPDLVLAGPRGIIEVSSADVVPGAGRVESISRRGGRWVVATSKGEITGR
jgi:hypothetical protein